MIRKLLAALRLIFVPHELAQNGRTASTLAWGDVGWRGRRSRRLSLPERVVAMGGGHATAAYRDNAAFAARPAQLPNREIPALLTSRRRHFVIRGD